MRSNQEIDPTNQPNPTLLIHPSTDISPERVSLVRIQPLRNRLVPAAVVRRPVRKQPVDDHAADREEEDEQAPEQLVRDGAV